jgi:hypothetical protein
MAKLKRRPKKPTSTPRPLESAPIIPSPALGGNTGITFQSVPSGSSADCFQPCSVFQHNSTGNANSSRKALGTCDSQF